MMHLGFHRVENHTARSVLNRYGETRARRWHQESCTNPDSTETMLAYNPGLQIVLAVMKMVLFFAISAALLWNAEAQTVRLTDAQAKAIGQKIWKNECAGTVDGLTSWNKGEDFASLGIGHFIWYVEGKRGPFEESFPKLIEWLTKNSVEMPAWLAKGGPCPWNTRAEFMADFQSKKMQELRKFLVATVPWQARFAALRLEQALPKMLAAAPPESREKIRENFYRVAAEPLGMYALIDYVNFKGEGILPTERYQGEGWGLSQVLESMKPGPPLPAFSRAAEQVLTNRVKNSPPARNEAKWLPGWRNRCTTYAP
jgi:hypothetical protein